MERLDDSLKIIPLGGGCEVGRSCVVLQYKGKTIMFDCGLHPARTGIDSLPYFDVLKTDTIDLLLVTHFHLDHCGAVPHFLEKRTFKVGRTYMTPPTKAIYKLNLSDYLRISVGEEKIFDENDLNNSMKKIFDITFHQNLEYNGIKFTCYNAGHVLGAAMFLVEIDGVKVLYTGDYSREEDRHIQPAEIPNVNIDILIVESTFGTNNHHSREQRENEFTEFIYGVVKNGGKCLLPVFVSGRVQELLLILDEFWENNPDIQNIPIYYSSSLAYRCMTVFSLYINMMGPYVRQQIKKGINPFLFKYVKISNKIEKEVEKAIETVDACVLLATPGMLQNGLSRKYFEQWCHSEKNGVMISGYCVEGTLAKTILSNPEKIQKSDGTIVPMRMQVKNISFCAHSDFAQTTHFITNLNPKNVVLVHGEEKEAEKLMKRLRTMFPEMRVEAPKNTTIISFLFEPKNSCLVIGSLADEIAQVIQEVQDQIPADISMRTEETMGDNFKGVSQQLPLQNMSQAMEIEDEYEGSIPIDGILLKKDNEYLLMNTNDLSNTLGISVSNIIQEILIPYTQSFELVFRLTKSIFESLAAKSQDGKYVLVNLVYSFNLLVINCQRKWGGCTLIQVPLAKYLDYLRLRFPTDLMVHNEDIKLSISDGKYLKINWLSSKRNDIIAENLAFFFSQIPYDAQYDPFNSLQNRDNLEKAIFLVRHAFPEAIIDDVNKKMIISTDKYEGVIDYSTYPMAVESANQDLKMKITKINNEICPSLSNFDRQFPA